MITRPKVILAMLLLSIFVSVAAGCSTVKDSVTAADQWVKDNAW